MDQFARLCWLWRTIYSALNSSAGLPFVHTERYEDLFFGEDRLSRLERTLSFLFDGASATCGAEPVMLQERIHANVSYAFPDWREWTRAQAAQLDSICGELMRELGYGRESEWLSMLARPG